MKYAGLMKQSLVDYPGEIAAVLFTRGCNMRCPYCHNADLLLSSSQSRTNDVEFTEILSYLKQRRGFLDAVVISGGEPTLNREMVEDIRAIKELGYKVKLDTNGTRPDFLACLIDNQLLDYVAMDIKHKLVYSSYLQAAGKLSREDFFHIKSSLHLLREAAVTVEFRTTVVPVLHTPQDIVEIAREIEGAPLYTLQQFNPRYTLDASWASQIPYRREEMQDLSEKCRPWVKKVRVVNI